ncbi:MAG TPA: virulence RhuM family protein [Bacteroidia bacterium]|nr:virulence RhuM family protein [Bacteroidia bacterium]
MSKEKNKIQIRNSTTDFLVFTAQGGGDTIEVRVQEDTVWLSQKMISRLFDVEVNTVNYHLKEIFKSDELKEISTIRKFRIVQTEGKRNISRDVDFYNLDAIISVGYRVNSQRATQFRQWATGVLREFAIKGYVMDKERLKNSELFGKDYFEHLLAEIREIRASERRFYQKITDIYSTASDYSADAPVTQVFFATVQNKLHFAIHGHTAAELIVDRADSKKEHMGLTTWKNAPVGKIVKTDVSVAKNYLTEKELTNLDRFVSMYLDYAESQAEKNIPMTMKDWSEKLNAFLKFNEKDILHDSGKVTQAIAKAFAESEFEKYRPIQDKLFESDFDREVKRIQVQGKELEEVRKKTKGRDKGRSK